MTWARAPAAINDPVEHAMRRHAREQHHTERGDRGLYPKELYPAQTEARVERFERDATEREERRFIKPHSRVLTRVIEELHSDDDDERDPRHR